MNKDDKELLAVVIAGIVFVIGILIFTIVRDKEAFDKYEDSTVTTIYQGQE